jgi:hypothetical protein
MACIPLPPAPALPTLPGGISLQPTLPSASFDPALCCKRLPFPVRTPNVSLPPFVLNVGSLTALNAIFDQAQDWIEAQAVPCPKE